MEQHTEKHGLAQTEKSDTCFLPPSRRYSLLSIFTPRSLLSGSKLYALPPTFLWLPAALLAFAAYLFLVQAVYDFTIDDVFISMRYADNLARHGELVWNPGETAKVEGYSNLLWVLLMAGTFRFLPWDPLLMTKLLSIAFGAATLVMFALLAVRLTQKRLLVFFSTVLMAVSRPFVVWGVSGMENMLYMFLILLALYLLVMEDERGKLCYVTPVVLFLICMTRTEGVVFFAAVFLVRAVRLVCEYGVECGSHASALHREAMLREERPGMAGPEKSGSMASALQRGRARRPTDREWFMRWIVYNAIFSILFLAWMGWKLWYYGSIIPLPVYLKTAQGGSGILYIRDFFLSGRVSGFISGGDFFI